MEYINPRSSTQFRYFPTTMLIILVVFAAGIFYVKPLWNEVDVQIRTRDQVRSQKDALSKELEILQTAAQSLDQSTEISRQLSLNAVPERFDEDKLIVDLTRFAQKNDVVLNGIGFGVSLSAGEKIRRASVNINITGSMRGFTGFLKSLEGAQRKIVVKTVAVQTAQTEENSSRANFNIAAETYYRDRL